METKTEETPVFWFEEQEKGTFRLEKVGEVFGISPFFLALSPGRTMKTVVTTQVPKILREETLLSDQNTYGPKSVE